MSEKSDKNISALGVFVMFIALLVIAGWLLKTFGMV
jgi:hypothetical protein